MRIIFLVLALSIALTNFSFALAAPRAQTRRDAFEPVACSTFQINDERFECGYVRVPEFHNQPDGAQIKLAVAILPRAGDASQAAGAANAFVVAQGGPGGSALDTFANFFADNYFPALKTLHAERDIVLYDQRGTLYAQPSLTCPEELALTLETLDQVIAPDEMLRREEQAALECRARLTRQGVRLDAYNSFENALDVEDLRRALGYEKFDFYGVSYGTLLALHALRATPDTFRSVILDAVVPAQINPNAQVPASMQRAFQELFNACAQDVECERAFPNLKQKFFETVDALNARPARVPLTDGETGKTYNAALDGDTYMNLLFQFIYNSELIPALPKLIDDAHNGHFDFISVYYPFVVFDRAFASGMYYSVMCAEDADFMVDDLALDGVDAHIAAAQKRDTAAFLQLCKKWAVPQLGARADEPVASNIPTLVLSGNFDPITPPPNGQAAAETLAPSYPYVFPAYGHGALTSGDCPNEMIADFVRDPSRAPNAQCIKETARINFLTPATHILSAPLGALQYALLQAKLQEFVIPLLALFALATVFFVGPLTWLIQRSRKDAAQVKGFARLAPWFAALASGLGTIFLAAWMVAVIVLALSNENVIGLILGLPRAFAPLFALAWLTALSAIALCVGVVLAWARGHFQIALRVYYTLLAAAALALTAWFAGHGMLTIWL